MKWMKLVPNWYEPFKIIFADHPVCRIEVKTQNRTFTKVVTRDRLKRARVMPLLVISMKTYLWKRKAQKII